MKTWTLLLMIGLLISCSSTKKTAFAPEPDALPELPFSELDIPVKIPAAAVFARAEALVPSEFTSEGWPGFMQPSCDFRYKYRFVRTPLQITCVNNMIGIRFGGNYQVSGSKCLCTAGIPVTPWISGSCGFAPQPLRKVNMTLSASLQFSPNYTLRTTTSVNQVTPVDKCAVSLFSSDITQLIMDSIRSSLISFAGAMDRSVAGLDFTKIINGIRDSSYRKINTGRYGYFLLNPEGFRIGQLNEVNDSFTVSLGVSCRPQFTSDGLNHIPVPVKLPALLQKENRNGVRLYVNMNYDYDFLNSILNDSLHNKVFEVKGRTIVIKNASIKGIGHHQLELRVDFAGSNHGSLFLRGTPLLDSVKQTLAIPDIQYSMEGEDLALKIARSLFKNKIRKTIQGKSFLDISEVLAANKKIIERQTNRELIPGILTYGNLKEAKILRMMVTSQGLQMQIFISGEVNILAGNL